MTSKIFKSYTDGSYGQLHCRGVYPDAANLPSVVCLHMSPKSGRSFHELMPELAVGRNVIAPDYPGHGESDLPPPEPHISIEDFAESIWQVANDRLGDGPVHLVGYHTGSMVAVEAARQRPEQVLSIINIGAPVFTEEELARASANYGPIPIDEEGTRYKVLWDRVIEHRGPDMTLQMCAVSMAENLRAGDEYEWGHRAAFAYAPRYPGVVAKTTQPLLIMNLNDDTYEQTLRMDEYLVNGRRVDYMDWAHGCLNAHPKMVAREMLDFFVEAETSV